MSIETRLIGGTFALAMACLFGFLGALVFLSGYKLRSKGRSAKGTIVSNKQRRHGNGRPTYSPEVAFETAEGEKIVFVASFGSNRKSTIGRTVKVLYYPYAPADADVASVTAFWIGPSIVMLIALGLLAVSIAFYAGFFPQ